MERRKLKGAASVSSSYDLSRQGDIIGEVGINQQRIGI